MNPFFRKDYKVLVHCCTYNQFEYIERTLNGFVLQKTNFPFLCLVVDDCSTDGEQEVIERWMNRECELSLQEQFEIPESKIVVVPHKDNTQCFFAFYFLKKNLYKEPKKKQKLYNPWLKDCKYIAFCEGDDYWIKSSKLQTQVKWMEENPEYTMCCSDADIVSSQKLNWTRYSEDCDISAADMILGGGLWIQTCTSLYKSEIIREYSRLDFCLQCHVGDYCWQILSVLQGKVRYFNTHMAAYRYMSVGSWTSKTVNADYKKKINGWRSEVNMLQGFDAYSKRKYHSFFEKRIASWIYGLALFNGNGYRSADEIKEILSYFPEVRNFSFEQRIRLFLLKHRMHFLFEIKRKITRK